MLGGFTHTKKNQHIYRYKSVLLVTNKSRIGLEIVTKMEKNVSAVRTMQPFKESGHCSYNYGGTIVLDVLLSCTDFRMAKEATLLSTTPFTENRKLNGLMRVKVSFQREGERGGTMRNAKLCASP